MTPATRRRTLRSTGNVALDKTYLATTRPRLEKNAGSTYTNALATHPNKTNALATHPTKSAAVIKFPVRKTLAVAAVGKISAEMSSSKTKARLIASSAKKDAENSRVEEGGGSSRTRGAERLSANSKRTSSPLGVVGRSFRSPSKTDLSTSTSPPLKLRRVDALRGDSSSSQKNTSSGPSSPGSADGFVDLSLASVDSGTGEAKPSTSTIHKTLLPSVIGRLRSGEEEEEEEELISADERRTRLNALSRFVKPDLCLSESSCCLRIGSPSACSSDPLTPITVGASEPLTPSTAISAPSSVNSLPIDRCGPTKFGSLPSYECHWEGCDFPSTFTQHLVAEHVRQRHLATFTATVAPPGSKNVATTSPSRSRTHRRQHEYTCEWTTCKMFKKPSKSLEWLNRHVMRIHAGQKRHLYCIVDGCKAKFASRTGLERHVQSHFRNNESESIPKKYSKKKREGTCQPTYVDCMTRDAFSHAKVALLSVLPSKLTSSTPDAVMSGRAIEFTGEVIGKRTCNQQTSYLVRWKPSGMIPDSWQSCEADLKRQIDIRAFRRDLLAVKYPGLLSIVDSGHVGVKSTRKYRHL